MVHQVLDFSSVVQGFRVFRFKNVLDGCTNDNVQKANVKAKISLEPITSEADLPIEVL